VPPVQGANFTELPFRQKFIRLIFCPT
jgi:hypothetical protein